ncbi:MAG: hypothetical protein WBD95_05255 [Xanthobacteraceae bacterium]
MALLRKRNPYRYIPIHPDNVANRDWIILLEGGTVVGPRAERLRVALVTQERKIVKRWRSLRRRHFLVVEDYDPRIHVLFFCPQLYQYDRHNQLAPLAGEEIGKYVADALKQKAAVRRTWYNPTERVPGEPVISIPMLCEFDTLVVDSPQLQPSLSAHAELPRMNGKEIESLPDSRQWMIAQDRRAELAGTL